MKIVAHRGYSKKYPENTMLAFAEALKQGADAIELDVHFSSDKKLIVHHDYGLSYRGGQEGFISELASDYLRTVDVGSWFDPKFADQRMPFLQEVFEALGKNTQYELELKGFTKEFLMSVMETVTEHDLLGNIEFTSPHGYMLSALKRSYPRAKIGLFNQPLPDWMNERIGKAIIKNNALLDGIDVIHLPLSLLSAEYVAELHAEKFLVHAANCETEAELKMAYDAEADQLTTNSLDTAILVKKKYGK